MNIYIKLRFVRGIKIHIAQTPKIATFILQFDTYPIIFYVLQVILCSEVPKYSSLRISPFSVLGIRPASFIFLGSFTQLLLENEYVFYY
jgi:hypothetical protein